MRSISVAGLAIFTFALTACGGGNDSKDHAAPPASIPALGSRAMPGLTMTVTPETAIIAGQPASVLIAIPNLAAGATLTAAVGAERDTAVPATITALSAHHWRAAMTLPSPLPAGTCVLVTVTLADGSVLESGAEDFVLAHSRYPIPVFR